MSTQKYILANIAASDRPKHMYEYAVQGAGSFPIDMLRRDNCWPASQDDVMKMTDKTQRVIRIRSFRYPTVERWASFGWTFPA